MLQRETKSSSIGATKQTAKMASISRRVRWLRYVAKKCQSEVSEILRIGRNVEKYWETPGNVQFHFPAISGARVLTL